MSGVQVLMPLYLCKNPPNQLEGADFLYTRKLFRISRRHELDQKWLRRFFMLQEINLHETRASALYFDQS